MAESRGKREPGTIVASGIKGVVEINPIFWQTEEGQEFLNRYRILEHKIKEVLSVPVSMINVKTKEEE